MGTRLANELGLFGLSGNVWEWCFDVYSDSVRVIRGGSWYGDAYYCRSASRYEINLGVRFRQLGFRVLRSSVP